jgi:hypothetical protein
MRGNQEMGVRLGRFAADAKAAQGLQRPLDSTREFHPQTLDGNFNCNSNRIESYPQGV